MSAPDKYVSLRLEKDLEKMRTAENLLREIPNGFNKALSMALNRGVTSARAEATRIVRAEFTVKARDVRETFRIKKATPNNPEAVLSSYGHRFGFWRFKHTPRAEDTTGANRRPTSVTIKKSKTNQLRNGFKWRGQIFLRTNQTNRLGRKGQLVRPVSLSVPEMLNKKTVSDAIQKYQQEITLKRLDHETQWLLSKAKKG